MATNRTPDEGVNTGTRVAGLVVILLAGILSLPVAASPFDGNGSENWILPLQLGSMTVIGTLVGLVVPVVSGSAVRRATVGAVLGVVAAVIGWVVFFVLVSGFTGA